MATHLQVPSELRDSVTISTIVSESTTVDINAGTLSLMVAAHRVQIVTTAQNALCGGIDGECFAVFSERRRRRSRSLQSTLGQAALDVTRTYTYETSVNANASLPSLIAPALASIGSSFVGATTTALSAQPHVHMLGAPDAFALDEAFANPAVVEQQLALRLPGVALNMTAPVVKQPPRPPPPPIPRAPLYSPPPPALRAEAVWLTILLITGGITFLLYAYILYTRHTKLKRVAMQYKVWRDRD